MRSYRPVLFFAALFCAVAAAPFPAPLRAEPGAVVQEQIEQIGPTEEQQAVQFNKGLISYDQGDYARAFEFWLPLAQTDDLAAMRNVALLLKDGKGVERDSERALYFFERAGRAGLVSAQVNAAFMHLNGEGTPQDYKTASFWFHAAAVAGVPAARYNLGVMYEKGLGVERDPARALAWYALAARVGISRRTIARLENGEVSDPGVDQIRGLASVLRVPFDVLVERSLVAVTLPLPREIRTRLESDEGPALLARIIRTIDDAPKG